MIETVVNVVDVLHSSYIDGESASQTLSTTPTQTNIEEEQRVHLDDIADWRRRLMSSVLTEE